MKWLILALGIVTDVSSVTCMKLSEGFSRWIPSVLTFVFMGISLAVFIFALKRFDLSFAYAIWAGLGILLVAFIGIWYFKEPVTALKIASIILIVLGVTGLSIGDLVRH
jgi:small multidrug resistance pump